MLGHKGPSQHIFPIKQQNEREHLRECYKIMTCYAIYVEFQPAYTV